MEQEPSMDDDSYNEYVCFTDGSSIKNPGKAGYAYIIIGLNRGEKLTTNSTILAKKGASCGIKTSNQMELLAILKTLQWLVAVNSNGRKKVTIYSDSEYSVKAITIWSKTWTRDNTWEAKKNVIEIKSILGLCKLLNVKFVHMYSHKDPSLSTNNYFNDLVDKDAHFYASNQ